MSGDAIGGVVSGLPGMIAGVAASGWAGVAAIVVGLLAVALGAGWAVKRYNSGVDARDLANAGADAGNTAVDLANQGQAVRQGLDAAEKADPPTEGFPQ